MSLKGMYAYAQQVAQGHFHGTIEERNGTLEFKGTVATEAEKNDIWNAIKTIPTWREDINADIRVTGGPASAAPTAPPPTPPARGTQSATATVVAPKTYTVSRSPAQTRDCVSRHLRRLFQSLRSRTPSLTQSVPRR